MLNQKQIMENYNYWNDPRVINSMIDEDSFFVKGSKTLINMNWVQNKWIEHTEGDFEEGEEKGRYLNWLKGMGASDNKKVQCISRFECCYQCEGNGKMVNPAIDAGGLTMDDFYEDPDFYDSYHSGMYDITCSVCNGSGQIQIMEYDTKNKLYNWCCERLAEHYEAQHEYAMEVAAERRWGA